MFGPLPKISVPKILKRVITGCKPTLRSRNGGAKDDICFLKYFVDDVLMLFSHIHPYA